MPQLAPIVIKDGAATPVDHTFAPVTSDGQKAVLKERSGIPLAFPGLATNVRPPVAQNDIYKVNLTLTLPRTTVVDGVTKVDHTLTADVSLLMSNKSTEQDRKDLRVMVANLLQNATVVTMVEKLEPQY